MTTMTWIRRAMVPAVLLLASVSCLAAEEPTILHATGQEMTGTWLVDVHPATGQPFLFIITFHSDGTCVATAGNNFTSAAYGAWARVGDRQFSGIITFFLFDANRNVNGRVKGRFNVALGDSLETFTVSNEQVIMDLDGNVLQVVPGFVATGKRVAIERQATPVAPAATDSRR
jgi:hypothetical protein